MDPREVGAFVNRPWAKLAASKRAYWSERYATEGWRAAWEAAQALLEHARRVQPEFPGPGPRGVSRLEVGRPLC